MCPFCGRRIDWLLMALVTDRGVAFYCAFFDSDVGIVYDYTGMSNPRDLGDVLLEQAMGESSGEIRAMLYYCPKCRSLLFTREEDSEMFLSGIVDKRPLPPPLWYV
jgi:hypothetical protein